MENRLRNEEIQDIFDWILHLGGSRKCAKQLAPAICEHPCFNLYHFRKRWYNLAQRMGSNQLSLVDAMVLREIRELLPDQPSTVTNLVGPSSPSNLIWNSSYAYNNDSIRDNFSSCRIITSTPLRHNPVEKSNAYNIDYDPRNIDNNIPRDHHHNVENGSLNRNNVDYRCVHGFCSENAVQNPQCGFSAQHRYGNYAIRFNDINCYTKGVQYPETDTFNVMNIKNTDLKSRHRLNFPLRTEDQFRPNCENVNHHLNRKRFADRTDETQMEHNTKRRHTDGARRFSIGAFEMPYVKVRLCPLPQSERKSYAIAFFKRNHCFIIGGPNTIAVDAEKFSTQGMFKISRNYCKLIRRSIQEKWNENIVEHYDDWNNWWEDHKWCEHAINIKLVKYRGVNVLQKTFLNLNFKNPNSVQRLLELARMALAMNTNNFQSILDTIFEIKNWKFLEKLTLDDFGKLQDTIRYVPNKLWLNIMRSMVFLWRNYYEIQTNSSPENEKNRYATSAQWNSYLFHWLTKQAYEELKQISQNDWSLHERVFPKR